MATQIWADSLIESALSTGISVPLTTGLLGLFQSSLVLSPSIPLATVVAAEAAFAGYARQALGATPGIYLDPVLGWILPTPGLLFTYTGTPTEIIYGWFIVNSGATVLFAAGNFITPKPLTVNGQGILLQLNFQLGYPPPLEAIMNGTPQGA
jgi:hypothetical protein